MARVMNFGSGPGALPSAALERARDELLDIDGTGMSIVEHGHRGATYDAVHEEARALLKKLCGLPDSHEVLFLQGGASQQFAQVPMAWLGRGDRAGYVVNGMWGEKALGDARTWASSVEAAEPVSVTSRRADGSYVDLPDEAAVQGLGAGLRYVHTTSNETIHGIEWEGPFGSAMSPPPAAPWICDVSSDFLWKPIDYSRYAFAYAGAQKNVGPSGLVVAVADKAFVAEARRDLPRAFRYDLLVSERSLVNTPPTFSVYMTRNVLAWLDAEGGLEVIGRRNLEKARVLYGALDDAAGFYDLPVAERARSAMNAVFRLPTPELEKRFLADAKAEGMVGLAGHRAVGGCRAALYNAIPLAWVQALADFARQFAARHG